MTSRRDKHETSDGEVTQSHVSPTFSSPEAADVENLPSSQRSTTKFKYVVKEKLEKVVKW